MERWEYCLVHFGIHRLIQFTPNGRQDVDLKRDKSKGDRSDYDAAERAIAQLGLEGWELVGASSGGVAWPEVFFFKRRIL